MNNRVLCVDDEAGVLVFYQRALRRQFTVDAVESGAEALELMAESGPYAAVVADLLMPGMDGLQLLAQVREKWPETVRIMLTGDLEHQTVLEAVNASHVYSFLNKPCPPEILLRTVDSAVKHYALAVSERELLEKTLSGSVQVLIDVLAMVDANAFGRGQALKEQVQALLPLLNQPPSWECEMAASLATIGAVTIPPSVLYRWRVHGEMGSEEQEMLRQVPLAGNRLIAKIPRLEEVARIILYQSKNFDGSGFPEDALAGAAIPLGARLLKVLSDLMDFEDGAMPREEVLPIMERRSGLYDPAVLQAVSKLPSSSRNAKMGAEGSSLSIKFRDLRPGHVLISNITTPDGVVVVPGGQKISPTMLELLRNFSKLGEIQEPLHVQA